MSNIASSEALSSPRAQFTLGQIIFLGLVSTIGPISTDMYLPAFPELERDLNHGPGSAQLTLASWFVGLAIGQFFLGPLSDRFGRLRPLQAGLLLYAAASIVLAMTSSYELFCLLRFVAALGGAISSVAPRAIVRDVATGRSAVKLMSQLTLVFGVGPILAPTLGSLLLRVGDWRLIFWAGALAAFILWLASIFLMHETLCVERRYRVHLAEILRRYGNLIHEPVFLSATLTASFNSFVTFSYLAQAPQLFEKLLAFSPGAFATFFGINAAGFIIAVQINARLARRFDYKRLMECGLYASAVFGVALLLISESPFIGPSNPWIACGLIMAMTFSLGFIGPNATVLAFTNHAHQAGAASALLGTVAFGLGGVSGLLMTCLPAHRYDTAAIGMLVGVCGMSLSDLWRRRAEARNQMELSETYTAH